MRDFIVAMAIFVSLSGCSSGPVKSADPAFLESSIRGKPIVLLDYAASTKCSLVGARPGGGPQLIPRLIGLVADSLSEHKEDSAYVQSLRRRSLAEIESALAEDGFVSFKRRESLALPPIEMLEAKAESALSLDLENASRLNPNIGAGIRVTQHFFTAPKGRFSTESALYVQSTWEVLNRAGTTMIKIETGFDSEESAGVEEWYPNACDPIYEKPYLALVRRQSGEFLQALKSIR